MKLSSSCVIIKNSPVYIGDPVGLVTRHEFKPGHYEYSVYKKDGRISEVRLCRKGFHVHQYDSDAYAMVDSGICGIAFVKPCKKLTEYMLQEITMDPAVSIGKLGLFTTSGYGDSTYTYNMATGLDGLCRALRITYIK